MVAHPGSAAPPARDLPPLMESLARVLAERSAGHEFTPNPKRRAAGVLVLFYLRAERLHLLFFRRTDRVPTHKGQVAFPGGSREAGDANLEETALREAREELGVDTTRVARLGPLKPFDTFVSNFVVSPFCGWLLDPDPVFEAQDFEVEEVLEVPLEELRRRKNRHRGRVPGFNVPFPLPYYRVDDAVIWGATGGIVEELLSALDAADAALARG